MFGKSKVLTGLAGLLVFAVTQACSTEAKTPDVTASVSRAIKQAGLKDVSVKEDRGKGVVTLTGKVASEAEKSSAESIAQSLAAGQVVGNEILVSPPGDAGASRAIRSDLDAAIGKNLDAALIANHLEKLVKYDVRSSVVTLTGEVNSQTLRSQVQDIAAQVPNVAQVVNELDVKSQLATSSR
jgi:osmotically-inducible protein OsmY